MRTSQDSKRLILGEIGLMGDRSVLFTNGWSNSRAAVGRLLGLTCKHLRMKSRASVDKDSATGGGWPLPIRNIACICSKKCKQRGI